MLELYHWEPNTGSATALICLHEKELEFEGHYIDVLKFEHLSDEVLRLNQIGQIPVLVHDGKLIIESNAMAQYLDDAFPMPPLMPMTPASRWRARRWLKVVGEEFAPAVAILGFRAFGRGQLLAMPAAERAAQLARVPAQERRASWIAAIDDSHPPELLDKCRRKLAREIGRMEDELGRGEWLAGTVYSLADIAVFAHVNGLPALVPELVNADATPAVMHWLEAVRARPAVQAALAASRTGSPATAFAPGPEFVRWG